jgi:hypothetical protein
VDEPTRVRTPHAELSLEEIATALPGTGEIMASVGQCYASCWHAAHQGNWELAAYFLRRVRGLQRRLAVIRPKYREQLEEFDAAAMAPVAAAIDRREIAAFDRAFGWGIERANFYHEATGKGYIRWALPAVARDDLDLGPTR